MIGDFDDSDEFDGATSEARGGWRKIFRLALARYKFAGLILFVTGISATVLEISAYVVILNFITQLDSGTAAAPFSFTLPFLDLANASVLVQAGLFLGLMLTSTSLFYIQGALVARYRRIAFQDTIERTLTKLIRFPDARYPAELGARGMARTLRRECRYVSRAIIDLLTLPRPALVLLAVIVLGIQHYPAIIAIAATLALLSLPLHIAVGRWGSKTVRNMIKKGGIKSQADRNVVERIQISTNVPAVDGPLEEAALAHGRDPRVSNFLFAYGRRMMLSPVSMLVSRLVLIVIITAIGLYIARQIGVGAFSLADTAMVILGFRLASNTLSSLIQTTVIVASYSPLIGGLLSFLYLDPRAETASSGTPPLTTENGAPLPKRFMWVGGPSLDRSIVSRINALWPADDAGVMIVTGTPGDTPGAESESEFRAWMNDHSVALSEEIQSEALQAYRDAPLATERGRALVAFWECERSNPGSRIFWDSKSFMSFGPADRTALLGRLSDRNFCLYFISVPKRLSALVDGNIFRLHGDLVIRVQQEVKPAKPQTKKKAAKAGTKKPEKTPQASAVKAPPGRQ